MSAEIRLVGDGNVAIGRVEITRREVNFLMDAFRSTHISDPASWNAHSLLHPAKAV
jgi:hypothetical protein